MRTKRDDAVTPWSPIEPDLVDLNVEEDPEKDDVAYV
jgi:hypothetical protein